MVTSRKKSIKSKVVEISTDRLSMYKEQYYFELNRKDSLGKELTLPVGLITLLIGAASYYAGKLDNLHSSGFHSIYALFLILSVLSIGIAVYYLIKSNYGHSYEYIPTSVQIEEYYQQLKNYFNQIGQSSESEPSFEKYLIDTYGQCNKRNVMSNDKKSAYLHNARTAIVCAILFSTVMLFVCNFQTTEKIFHVIFNKEAISNELETTSNTSTSPITSNPPSPTTDSASKR